MTNNGCMLCPRKCGVDRSRSKGFCGETDRVRIGAYRLHMWEEPVISGKRGSGAVFFSGCVMKCVFCQNHKISSEGVGYEVSVERLAKIFLELQEKGAHNINLVNPTHYIPQIISALEIAGDSLSIPIVYNSGGYERAEVIRALKGKIDIFLPDIKYFSDEAAMRYSKARGYFGEAISAVREMVNAVGKPVIDGGIMKSGVIVRHLVLPGRRKDSIEVIRRLGEEFSQSEILISLMSQYFPAYKAFDFPELSRKVSTFEYDSVVEEAKKFDWDGFIQERSSASECYVPDFSGEPL